MEIAEDLLIHDVGVFPQDGIQFLLPFLVQGQELVNVFKATVLHQDPGHLGVRLVCAAKENLVELMLASRVGMNRFHHVLVGVKQPDGCLVVNDVVG